MRVTYKIHRRPIILSIEMDAYPSLEDRRRSHEWNASFLLDVPLDQSALATLYIFCHGSKMDTINIHHSDSLLPISPPPFILVSTRWSIFPGIYRDEKIIATNKKISRSRHRRCTPQQEGKISFSKPQIQSNSERETCKFLNLRFNRSYIKLVSKFSIEIVHVIFQVAF